MKALGSLGLRNNPLVPFNKSLIEVLKEQGVLVTFGTLDKGEFFLPNIDGNGSTLEGKT